MLGLGNLLVSGAVLRTVIQKLVSDFNSRVVADGGNFEANTCLVAQLTILSNIE